MYVDPLSVNETGSVEIVWLWIEIRIYQISHFKSILNSVLRYRYMAYYVLFKKRCFSNKKQNSNKNDNN